MIGSKGAELSHDEIQKAYKYAKTMFTKNSREILEHRKARYNHGNDAIETRCEMMASRDHHKHTMDKIKEEYPEYAI